MYLKSIEVQGFKSFANKINFEFHNGITGIVGPNGSGKSNVADAVRWVLGEQRIKQLRGGKMEDVIFAGTESRRPLGFAYVAITLDNSDHKLAIDFNEVTVSRRLFRSGESEYMINGAICRLKDINELFYDTGIGKEGYSIIGQGQIDKILSGKPEERRELFDEAAGIVKFKRRKNEAIKKLQDEKDNLARVTDILSELERQLRPLERQSETARKYLKLKDELKIYDVNMFLLTINQVKDSIESVEKKILIASNELEEKTKTLDETKKQYEQLDVFIEELNSVIENKKNELNEANISVEKLDGEIKVLDEQINSARMNDEHYNKRISDIDNAIAEYNIEKDKLLKEKEEIKDMLNNASTIQSEADSKVAVITNRIVEIKEKIEDAKTEIIEVLNERANINSRVSRYDTMVEQINIRKATISQNLIKFKSDSDAQKKIINELEEELKAVNDEIINMTSEADELEKKISELSAEKKNLFKNQDDYQREFHRLNSNLEALTNMTERYEGYGNSIKKIMELKETKKGIIGVVADIISVDKKYETAVETALGGNIQNVVTDDENTAKEVIEYLKRGKFGRATFLPLNSIANKTGFSNERALSEKGVIGLACDLVKIRKEWENIAKYLLGRTVVVDNIDNALIIARKYGYTLRMVTLDGEQLNPGGSMSGGAFKNASNLLGRRREVDELKNSIEAIKVKQKEVADRLEANEKEGKATKENYEKIKLSLSEKHLTQNSIAHNLKTATDKQQEITDSFANINSESDEISRQLEEINNSCATMKDDLLECDNKNAALEDKVRELTAILESEQAKEAEEMKNNEDLRVNLSGLTQKNDFVRENISRVEGEIRKLVSEKESLKITLEDTSRDILSKINDINNIKASVEDKRKIIEKLSEELAKYGEDKDNQTKEHKDFFGKREELANHISELDKELFRLNSQKEKLEEEKEKQVNYMWDEYEMRYSDALTMKNDELTNLQQIRKTISTLKSDIKNLGEVNVNAINDYKEVLERHTFLKGQHDDLIIAEETLLKIIEELDTGMKKQFSEKFEEIKVEFDKVFKEMFGGGKGTIELLEDEETDMLDAGISIISQPPGKKLQNMMQLSGGEKALTAIALLFAIQNLKPSPFCLLDEIEAALDDSNVTRFAKYLHKLTDHTQFIVITHRRGTMAAADRLYGITMQEKGVSTLVSVNLIEDEIDKMNQQKN
ncbi:MAG: chromosome segregation protein SMC [Lachnospiraceae bacterium]|nr:chromosome segregation protein SMC [Lachnospiraceae bacterium]